MSSSAKDFLSAVRVGDLAKVKQLLGSQPDLVNTKAERGLSAIFVALYSGHREAADFLASKRKSLDVSEAAALGRLDLLRQIIESKPALVNSFSVDGHTPLGLASYLGQKASVEYLLSKGADVNTFSKNEQRVTALTGAISQGHREIVKLLLSKGAAVNYVYGEHLTPLAEAAFGGDQEIVKLLLAHGADINLKTGDGKTPLRVAIEKGHRAVVAMLRKHGAKG